MKVILIYYKNFLSYFVLFFKIEVIKTLKKKFKKKHLKNAVNK